MCFIFVHSLQSFLHCNKPVVKLRVNIGKAQFHLSLLCQIYYATGLFGAKQKEVDIPVTASCSAKTYYTIFGETKQHDKAEDDVHMVSAYVCVAPKYASDRFNHW